MEGLLSSKNKLVLLLDLGKAKKLDPWEIDISGGLREALESLGDLRRTNFALLGLLLFNSSVIYELKAKSLLRSDAGEGDGRGPSLPEEKPPPFVPSRAKPKVDFLAMVISALLSSVGRGRTSRRSPRPSPPNELRPLPPPEPDFNIEEWRERISTILRVRGPTMPLKDVLAVFKGAEVLKAFLTLLHMAQDGLIRFSRLEDGAVLVSLAEMGEP